MTHEFRKRLLVLVIVVLVFSVMNSLFKHWIFSSIGYCICGLLCIVKPVKLNDIQPEKNQFLACRIAGALLILLGIMVRSKFY